MMTFDARKAVERYIDRFGPDAFERVIRAVCYKQLLSQSYKYFFTYYKNSSFAIFFHNLFSLYISGWERSKEALSECQFNQAGMGRRM